MMEQIIVATDRKISDVRELKSSSLPVVMYGAGSYAADVTRFLKRHDITVNSYCVDRQYLRPGQVFNNSAPISAIEDAYNKYPDFNLIIGFADYVKAKQVLASIGDNARIYFIDAPNQETFFDYSYVKQHQGEFEDTYLQLEDQKSKDIFIAFINAKLSGDPTPLYQFADFNQYFGDPISLNDHETFVDCGAYDGDTISSFLANTRGKYNKIYAFEPEKENYLRLASNIKNLEIKKIETVNMGAWSERTNLSFSSEGNTAMITPAGGDISIAVDSIDNVVNGEPVTYIKMDIEGAELGALEGAEFTIKKCRPKLAVCVYHKPEDLITLPQYIKSLSPDYKLYLRHHQYMSWEMVLYAIID